MFECEAAGSEKEAQYGSGALGIPNRTLDGLAQLRYHRANEGKSERRVILDLCR